MSERNRRAAEALVGPYLEPARVKQGLDYVFYMFTDVRGASTDLLFAGKEAPQVIARAFNVESADGCAVLPGVLSRKKQLVPALIDALKHISE